MTKVALNPGQIPRLMYALCIARHLCSVVNKSRNSTKLIGLMQASRGLCAAHLAGLPNNPAEREREREVLWRGIFPLTILGLHPQLLYQQWISLGARVKLPIKQSCKQLSRTPTHQKIHEWSNLKSTFGSLDDHLDQSARLGWTVPRHGLKGPQLHLAHDSFFFFFFSDPFTWPLLHSLWPKPEVTFFISACCSRSPHNPQACFPPTTPYISKINRAGFQEARSRLNFLPPTPLH